MLLNAGAATLGLSAFPFGWAAAADKKKQTVLFFTRCPRHEHEVVVRKGDALSLSERVLTELGRKNNFDVVCIKDGAVFDGKLDQYDCIAFYTAGDLTGESRTPQPGTAMSPEGKKKFMAAIEAGKGFVGIHTATDTFRSSGIDPYIAIIGGEFLGHDAQQKARIKVVDPRFPGIVGLGDGFEMMEEWYSCIKFAPDLHVILVQADGRHGGEQLPTSSVSSHMGQDARQGPGLLHLVGPSR